MLEYMSISYAYLNSTKNAVLKVWQISSEKLKEDQNITKWDYLMFISQYISSIQRFDKLIQK